MIAAYNEDDVIERKLENALALDYPRDRLRILVASDASSDGTDEIVRGFADRGVELVRAPRGGKVNAQNHTVRTLTDVDVVAFSDANCEWAPDALQQLVAPLADPRVAYVCGRLQLRSPEGTNQEGAYWRYEIWLRARESLVHSVTGGNGSIYAVRRERYEEVDPRFGHDLSFPYLMVKRGFRAVYAPRAVALEKMTTDLSDEFRRKVRMFGHCWLLVAARAHVRTARAGSALLGRDDLPPPAALRERHPASRAARHLRSSSRSARAASTRSCSGCTSCSRCACWRPWRCGAGCGCSRWRSTTS